MSPDEMAGAVRFGAALKADELIASSPSTRKRVLAAAARASRSGSEALSYVEEVQDDVPKPGRLTLRWVLVAPVLILWLKVFREIDWGQASVGEAMVIVLGGLALLYLFASIEKVHFRLGRAEGRKDVATAIHGSLRWGGFRELHDWIASPRPMHDRTGPG